jgi:hypothetical protein
MFPGWFGLHWWETDDVLDHGCTIAQVSEVVAYSLYIGTFKRNPEPVRGVAGLTVEEFEVMYHEKVNTRAGPSVGGIHGGGIRSHVP